MKKKIWLFFLAGFLIQNFGFPEDLRFFHEQKVSSEINKAFAVLTGSKKLIIGRVCGRAGKDPDGLSAIRVLAKYKRYDLISKALNGNNFEGKVYAAWAFLKLQKRGVKLSEAVKKVIEGLRNSDRRARTCMGCLLTEEKIMDILNLDGPSSLARASLDDRSDPLGLREGNQ